MPIAPCTNRASPKPFKCSTCFYFYFYFYYGQLVVSVKGYISYESTIYHYPYIHIHWKYKNQYRLLRNIAYVFSCYTSLFNSYTLQYCSHMQLFLKYVLRIMLMESWYNANIWENGSIWNIIPFSRHRNSQRMEKQYVGLHSLEKSRILSLSLNVLYTSTSGSYNQSISVSDCTID